MNLHVRGAEESFIDDETHFGEEISFPRLYFLIVPAEEDSIFDESVFLYFDLKLGLAEKEGEKVQRFEDKGVPCGVVVD